LKHGGGYTDSTLAYNAYKGYYDQRYSVVSPLIIDVRNSWVTQNVRALTQITIKVDKQVTTTQNKLWAVVFEKDIYVTNYGGYNLPTVVRARVIYQDFTLTQVGQSQGYSTEFDIDKSWNPAKLGVAVFVQSDETKEVLQSAWADIAGQTNMKKTTWGSIKKLYQ